MRFSRSPLSGPIPVVAGDVISNEIELQQDYGFAFQAIWTGALLIGTLKVQATIDGVTWSDVTDPCQVNTVVNGPGSFIWNVSGAFYHKARVYFTRTSGTGSITVWAETKGP